MKNDDKIKFPKLHLISEQNDIFPYYSKVFIDKDYIIVTDGKCLGRIKTIDAFRDQEIVNSIKVPILLDMDVYQKLTIPFFKVLIDTEKKELCIVRDKDYKAKEIYKFIFEGERYFFFNKKGCDRIFKQGFEYDGENVISLDVKLLEKFIEVSKQSRSSTSQITIKKTETNHMFSAEKIVFDDEEIKVEYLFMDCIKSL